MPKPLTQEADEKPIHEQVRELMRKAHTERMAPIGIKFSVDGYHTAMKQTVPGMDPWGDRGNIQGSSANYLGLPWELDRGANAPLVSLVLVPGGSAEAQAFRAAGRDTHGTLEQAGRRQGGARFTARGPMDKPTVEILAEGLTRAQLSDLITAWCDANPGDAMEDGLRDTVAKYGEFE